MLGTVMSTTIKERVNSNEIDDETHSLTGHEPGDVEIYSENLSTTVTSEEVPRQIKAAVVALTEHLQRLCYFMREFSQVSPRRNKETSAIGLTEVLLKFYKSMLSSLSNWKIYLRKERNTDFLPE